MPLEDVAHGLVTDGVAQVGEGPDDPVIAPGAILLGHTDHQVLDLLINTRTAYGLKELRGYPETFGPHCIAFKPPSDDNEKQD